MTEVQRPARTFSGGDRHEANWSDRGARRPVEHVRRRGDGRPALAVGAGNGWQVFPLAQTFTEPTVYYGFEIQGRQLVAKVFMKALKTVDGLCFP